MTEHSVKCGKTGQRSITQHPCTLGGGSRWYTLEGWPGHGLPRRRFLKGGAGLTALAALGASTLKLGDIVLTTANEVPAEPGAPAQAVIRPERVGVEEHGSAGANRVPALVDRLVYLGPATQVYLRLATGEPLQAVAPNADAAGWSQGIPMRACLPPDALPVLAGDAEPAPADAEAAAAA